MRKLLEKIGIKKAPKLNPTPDFQGIDPRRVTAMAVNQVAEILQKISGDDVTVELAITHVLHERAKAKYFTTQFPAANGHV